MATYDFRNLSPFDFECITRDLLQEELEVPLESFAAGRDRGIDFRYSTGERGALIVQCKHFVNSGWTKLRSHLKQEVRKVEALSPKRYCLSTSVPLTPNNKDEIKDMFAPYVLGTGDIYGQEDLNNLLGKHDRVERRHFKLWLTSTTILQKLIRSDIYTDTDNHVLEMERRIRLYVYNPSYVRAGEILQTHRFCLITGIPGIGKTILADMLMIAHIDQGFEPVVVSADIAEANAVFDVAKKQIFYYDDFLGQTGQGDKLGKNEDSRLLAFVRRVMNTPNKRLILTTREYILADARLRYEKLSDFGTTIGACTVSLGDYVNLVRAKILYNHVFFSPLPLKARQALLDRKEYLRIVRHKNYSPRLIEKILDFSVAEALDGAAFVEFIMGTLDRPERLWDHAFNNQLSELERVILICLATLPVEADLVELEKTASEFARVRFGKPMIQREFRRAIKIMENTFISISREGADTFVRYHNPSVRDFVHGVIDRTPDEVLVLLQGAAFFCQGLSLWSHRHDLPGVGKVVHENADCLLESLERTIDAPGSRFEQVLTAAGKVKRRSFASRAARLTWFAEVATETRNDGRWRRWFAAQVDAVAATWAAGNGSPLDCARMVATGELSPTVVSVAKQFLLATAETTEDIDALGVLMGAIELTTDEQERARSLFIEVANSESAELLGDEDPERVGERRDWILATADGLGVSYYLDGDEIEAHIERLQREAPDDDYYHERYKDEAYHQRTEEAEIDSMFQTLCDDEDVKN